MAINITNQYKTFALKRWDENNDVENSKLEHDDMTTST